MLSYVSAQTPVGAAMAENTPRSQRLLKIDIAETVPTGLELTTFLLPAGRGGRQKDPDEESGNKWEIDPNFFI